MGSTPKEVIFRHVFKNSTYEMANADPVGFYSVGRRRPPLRQRRCRPNKKDQSTRGNQERPDPVRP